VFNLKAQGWVPQAAYLGSLREGGTYLSEVASRVSRTMQSLQGKSHWLGASPRWASCGGRLWAV